VPSQPVDVIKHSSRWAGQRWLLDAVIALIGPEWDQGRVAYYAAACGQDSQVDFTAVRPRIRKYDDLARGFSKAARRREVLARDAVHLQGNVSRDGRRSPDRTRLMAERDARQQGISFDEAIAAIADSIPAKRLAGRRSSGRPVPSCTAPRPQPAFHRSRRYPACSSRMLSCFPVPSLTSQARHHGPGKSGGRAGGSLGANV
jgi:hypothetical protein